MLAKQIKVRMKVKIISIKTTHTLYNSNHDMEHMVGKIYTITHKNSSKKYPDKINVKLSSSILYRWAPENLQPIEKIKKIKGGKFDIENLVI